MLKGIISLFLFGILVAIMTATAATAVPLPEPTVEENEVSEFFARQIYLRLLRTAEVVLDENPSATEMPLFVNVYAEIISNDDPGIEKKVRHLTTTDPEESQRVTIKITTDKKLRSELKSFLKDAGDRSIPEVFLFRETLLPEY